MSVAGAGHSKPKKSKPAEKAKPRIRCYKQACLLEPNIKIKRGTDFDLPATDGPGVFVCPPKLQPNLTIDAVYLEPLTQEWIPMCLHIRFLPKIKS